MTAKTCSHKWSDPAVGIRTGQKDRRCLKCDAVQHTVTYTDHNWIDGPPLFERLFRDCSTRLAVAIKIGRALSQ